MAQNRLTRLHHHGLYRIQSRWASAGISGNLTPSATGACVDPRPGGPRHRLAFRTFRCYPRVVEGLELNQISETEAERRAELMANPRKIAKPTKAMPEQIDPNRLSKAIQYLKDHLRR